MSQVQIINTKENKDYQAGFRKRAKGAIHNMVRLLAIFTYFQQQNKIPEEMLPYFWEFLDTRIPESVYVMQYYNKAVKNEIKRISKLDLKYEDYILDENESNDIEGE